MQGASTEGELQESQFLPTNGIFPAKQRDVDMKGSVINEINLKKRERDAADVLKNKLKGIFFNPSINF